MKKVFLVIILLITSILFGLLFFLNREISAIWPIVLLLGGFFGLHSFFKYLANTGEGNGLFQSIIAQGKNKNLKNKAIFTRKQYEELRKRNNMLF